MSDTDKKYIEVKKEKEYRLSKKVILRISPYSSGYIKANMKAVDDLGQIIAASISAVNSMLSYREEMRILMPTVLGSSPNSPEWDKLLKDYWNNLTVKIPEIGKTLEIGWNVNKDDASYKTFNDILNKQNSLLKTYNKEVANNIDSINFREHDEYNSYLNKFIDLESTKCKVAEPLNLPNYIFWRYCLVSRDVANKVEFSHNSKNIRVYIEDQAELNKHKKITHKVSLQATQKMIEILSKRSTVKNVLYVMEKYVAADSKDNDDQDIALDAVSRSKPAEFLKVCKDVNLQTKAFIMRCINKSLLRRIPNTQSIVTPDGLVNLGDTMDDCIISLKHDKNKELLNTLTKQLENLDK